MDYQSVVAVLRNFSNILVTGPQRSGTTICAKMIASDLNLRYVDENEFKVDKLHMLLNILGKEQNIVMQAPGLSRFCHLLNGYDVAVVFMRRDIESIIQSQERIAWPSCNEKNELSKYGYDEGIISEIKYAYWDNYQKQVTKHHFEFHYDALKSHPLWIDKEQRVDFKPRQIEL